MTLDRGTRMHDGHEINVSTATHKPRVEVPVTTNVITLGVDDRVLWVNPAGTIAALTVKLPPAPVDGEVVEISFNQIVTTLTVQDAAAAAVETSAGAVSVANRYRRVSGSWVRWG